jgi:hypothetical protein
MCEPRVNSDSVTFWIAIVGAVTGVLGFALSLINTVHDFHKNRISVAVDPAFSTIESEQRLCVGIRNLSAFPITIDHIGFLGGIFRKRYFPCDPVSTNQGPLPHRIESRTLLAVLCPPRTQQQEFMTRVRSVYVSTACGQTFTGSSPELRQHIKSMKRAWKRLKQAAPKT